jgi:hypothetical protein
LIFATEKSFKENNFKLLSSIRIVKDDLTRHGSNGFFLEKQFDLKNEVEVFEAQIALYAQDYNVANCFSEDIGF